MDDEVEDLVGDIKYTDSQKSVTTSAVYSLDFTDSSSDKNNSSGKETYVIEQDSDDSDTFHIHTNESILDLTNRKPNKNHEIKQHNFHIDRAASTSLHKCNIVSQEIFTQTSKTIMEIAQSESFVIRPRKNLETQTSFVSITENKSVEFRIHVIGANRCHNIDDTNLLRLNNNMFSDNNNKDDHRSPVQSNVLEISTSNISTEKDENYNEESSFNSSDKDIIQFIEDDTNVNTREGNIDKNETQNENTSEFELSLNSDIDSLVEIKYANKRMKSDGDSETSEFLITIDSDVEELYNNLSKSPQLLSPVCVEPTIRKFGILTPLTEETVPKKDSIFDLTPSIQTLTRTNADDASSTLFEHNSDVVYYDQFKLPPIQKNRSWPNSPQLNVLFSVNTPNPIEKCDTLPSLYEKQNNKFFDQWKIDTKELACGESPGINQINDSIKRSKNSVLPPIHLEGYIRDDKKINIISARGLTTYLNSDEISIKGKIKELKLPTRKLRPKFSSRSGSPSSGSSPDDTRISDAAERGCEGLCSELLQRLRSSSWVEINETLMDLPRTLEKFWSVISEFRIADLLRQVTIHIESPRTQVARAACRTVAQILKNTNYTKKPDFYETISTLLTKTGSYNRPVRREANVALDDVVCSVDVTQCVTAICVYGVSLSYTRNKKTIKASVAQCLNVIPHSNKYIFPLLTEKYNYSRPKRPEDHKSALVRCASARLLVVCCAFAEGGRRILRTRPPTAAYARRYALRSLAELLQDKYTDTRKYAERMYSMLRPLPNFEAYFLTDVDVELASKLMKKYDQVLIEPKTR